MLVAREGGRCRPAVSLPVPTEPQLPHGPAAQAAQPAVPTDRDIRSAKRSAAKDAKEAEIDLADMPEMLQGCLLGIDMAPPGRPRQQMKTLKSLIGR